MKYTQEFWAIPKEVFAMRDLPLEARCVYGILFTRMNGDNVAWPGQKNIAETLGVGERSVERYVRLLKDKGLIEVEKGGNGGTNRYYIPSQTRQIGGTVKSRPDSRDGCRPDSRDGSYIIEKNSKKRTDSNTNQYKNTVMQILELFAPVNPHYESLYQSYNQREAIKSMVKIHGREKLEKIVKFLPMVEKLPKAHYAPRITTPLELQTKFAALEKHVKSVIQKKTLGVIEL